MSASLPRTAQTGILSADDRLLLLELQARYNWAIDTYDVEEFVDLFVVGGVLDVPSGPHTDLRHFMHTVTREDWTRGQQHWLSNHVFAGDASRCVVKSQMILPRRHEGTHDLVVIGYYVDTCVKSEADGRWRFLRRFWRAWEGDVLLNNPSLPTAFGEAFGKDLA